MSQRVMNLLPRAFIKGVFLWFFLASVDVNAEEIRTRADLGISVSEIYTDNRCLVRDDKEDAWSTSVSLNSGSGLGYSRQGSRASLSLDGSVQINTDKDDRAGCDTSGSRTGSRFSPRLRANGKVELIEQILFVDASASARQTTLDPFSISDENETSRQNRNTTYTYKVSPYLKGRIKDFAQGVLRFNYDDQYNSEDGVDDSSRSSATLDIDSISDSKLSWGISGDYTRESYDQNNLNEGRDNDFASASARLGYQISKRWKITGTTGQDFNDFKSTLDENDGSFWNAAINWDPSPRTSIEVGTGERFYGSNDRFSITHKHRRSNFSASYNKSLTSSRTLREEDVFLLITDFEGNPIYDEFGQPLILTSTATTLTRSPIINESLKLGYRLQGRRSSIAVDASESKQLRTEDNRSSVFRDISLSGNRTLSRDATFNGRITYRERTADSGSEALGSDSESWIYTLGLSRDIGSKSKLSLNYTHTDRRSDNVNNEYKENRIIATIRVNF